MRYLITNIGLEEKPNYDVILPSSLIDGSLEDVLRYLLKIGNGNQINDKIKEYLAEYKENPTISHIKIKDLYIPYNHPICLYIGKTYFEELKEDCWKVYFILTKDKGEVDNNFTIIDLTTKSLEGLVTYANNEIEKARGYIKEIKSEEREEWFTNLKTLKSNFTNVLDCIEYEKYEMQRINSSNTSTLKSGVEYNKYLKDKEDKNNFLIKIVKKLFKKKPFFKTAVFLEYYYPSTLIENSQNPQKDISKKIRLDLTKDLTSASPHENFLNEILETNFKKRDEFLKDIAIPQLIYYYVSINDLLGKKPINSETTKFIECGIYSLKNISKSLSVSIEYLKSYVPILQEELLVLREEYSVRRERVSKMEMMEQGYEFESDKLDETADLIRKKNNDVRKCLKGMFFKKIKDDKINPCIDILNGLNRGVELKLWDAHLLGISSVISKLVSDEIRNTEEIAEILLRSGEVISDLVKEIDKQNFEGIKKIIEDIYPSLDELKELENYIGQGFKDLSDFRNTIGNYEEKLDQDIEDFLKR